MSDELSDIIRRQVRRGSMTHLSVISTDGETFKAAWRGVDNEDHRIVESPDIVDALVCALTGRKPIAVEQKAAKPKRKRAEKPASDNFEDLLG